MNKNFRLLLVSIWLMSSTVMYGGSPAVFSGGGTGTLADPYRVNNLTDLTNLSTTSTFWAADKYFIQTANIDASSTSTLNSNVAGGYYGFLPIGNATTKFAGNYNGQGFTITGLYINRPTTDYIGLFGKTASTATISNLGLLTTTIYGNSYVGGLVGDFGGTVSKCFSSGSVIGTSNDIGGLIGNSTGTISNCYSTSSVSGLNMVAGLLGYNLFGTISYCYSTGVVFSTNPTMCKGLIGRNDSGTVGNSYWDTETSGQTLSGGGTGKSTAEMKTLATFTGWDFAANWKIDGKNSGYPYLAWQVFPAVPMQLKFTTTAASQSIELPLNGTVNCTVNWGDGTATQNFTTAGAKSHTFAEAGNYTVSISGSLTWFGAFSDWAGVAYLTSVSDFGSIGLTDLSGAFIEADNLTSVPTTLPTTVTNLGGCFSFINQNSITNLDSWNTSSVTNMRSMFIDASAFNQNISNWDVSNVTDMSYMFEGTSFNQNIGSWKISAVTTMEDMFSRVTLSTTNYDALLKGWAAQTVQSAVSFNGGSSKYSTGAATAARDVLTGGTNLWVITDGGQAPIPMQLKFTTTAASQIIKLPLLGTVNCTVNWGDGTATQNFNTAGRKTHTFATAGTYTVNISGSLTQFGYYDDDLESGWSGAKYLTEVIDFGNVGLTSLYGAFCDADNLSSVPATLPSSVTDLAYCFIDNDRATITNLDLWDVSHVTNMYRMFSYAYAFNQPIGNWTVSNVTNMGSMFYQARAFNQPIGDWIVSSVTDMSEMFNDARLFNQNIGGWNVGNVTNMKYMFAYAPAFNQNIGSWNVSKVTNLSGMFNGATAFNQNIGSWTVSNVTTMSSMFRSASAFNQNIGSWTVSNVTDMSYMFNAAIEFDQNIGSWNIAAVTDMTDMFKNITLSTANYDALLIGWAPQTVKPNVVFGGGNSKYTEGAATTARDVLTGAPKSWVITDGGQKIFSGGAGTLASPYQIATLDDLRYLSENSSYWAAGLYFIQTANIDASSTSTWNDNGDGGYYGFSPIGNNTTNFIGSYDGQGHVISGLYINRDRNLYTGMFGYTNGASTKIENLGVVNVNLIGGLVGGLVGSNYSTINKCYSTGIVVAERAAGGLVGANYATIDNCYSTATATASENFSGGLVGGNLAATAVVSNSYSTGTTLYRDNFGGLIGLNQGTTTNCFWNTVTSGNATSAGGTGKTTAEMKTLDTFSTWDFVTTPVWKIESKKNYGYPYLANQSSVAVTGSDVVSGTLTNSDVTVSGTNTVLTVDAPKTLNSVTVEPGAKLDLTNTLTISGDLTLKSDESGSFNAKVGTGIALNPASKVRYIKTMLDTKWYFVSFPCTVNINEITQVEGGAFVLGTDWYIKYYNGQTRATNRGGANWVEITDQITGTLTANKGYIIGLKSLVGTKHLSFVLDQAVVTSAETLARTIPVEIYDATAGTHAGWNLVGQPFLSRFAGNKVTGAPLAVTIPDAINGMTYTQPTMASATFEPFSAYFVQVLANGNMSFATDGRSFAPAAVASDLSDRVQLNFTSATGVDYTNLVMDNDQTTGYQIGQDLEKWIGTDTDKPQIYTQLGGINYGFNALPMTDVQNLPVGIYTKTAGTTTISADAALAPSLSKLILFDSSNGTTTDLLISSYSFIADAGTNNTRFSITAQRISTNDGINEVNRDANISIANGGLLLINIAPSTIVRVYDAIGRLVVNKTMNSTSMEIKLNAKGIYTVQLQNGTNTSVRKVIF